MDQTVPIHVGHGQVSQYQIDMTHVADVFYEQDDQALESILSSDLGQPLSSRICLIASLK